MRIPDASTGAARSAIFGPARKSSSGNVTAQYPIPLLLSTGRRGHAYGVFYDNVHELRFDLAKSVSDEVRCDSPGGEIDLYVIDGPRLAQVVERYTGLTGRPSLPPLWALGLLAKQMHVSRLAGNRRNVSATDPTRFSRRRDGNRRRLAGHRQ